MKTVKKIIGYCGVDSGQLLIQDPCYARGSDYDKYSKATIKHLSGQLKFRNGQEKGVVFRSGFGDGVYPVIAHFKDFGVFGIRIAKVEVDLECRKGMKLLKAVLKGQEKEDGDADKRPLGRTRKIRKAVCSRGLKDKKEESNKGRR